MGEMKEFIFIFPNTSQVELKKYLNKAYILFKTLVQKILESYVSANDFIKDANNIDAGPIYNVNVINNSIEDIDDNSGQVSEEKPSNNPGTDSGIEELFK